MTPDEFRVLGHQLIEWVAAYRERLPELPVMSPVKPGEVRRHFAQAAPDQGVPVEGLLPLLDAAILPGVTHWNHPRFFAYFPSNSMLPSVLADLVAAGLGAQGMSWQTSPAATELEEVAMEWLRQLVGLPPTFSGVIQDTASTATLVALLCARERTTGHGQARGGLQAEATPLVVYASEMAHSSIEKAALLAGFGRENLRLLPSDEAHALRPDALEEALRADVARGHRPCAIVATVGSTGTTAIDPVARIGELARAHGAWLHVDAAMAGTAMACPELRWMWEGVEHADSVVWNPHKWLGIGFDCTAYHVRDPDHLVRVMATDPSYLRTAQDGAVKNFRDWGIALGRRFRSLKVWFVLSALGVEGVRAALEREAAEGSPLRVWVESEIAEPRSPGGTVLRALAPADSLLASELRKIATEAFRLQFEVTGVALELAPDEALRRAQEAGSVTLRMLGDSGLLKAHGDLTEPERYELPNGIIRRVLAS